MIQQYEDFERSIFNKGLEVLHMHVKESALWSFFDWEEGFGIGSSDINACVREILKCYFKSADDAPDHEFNIVRKMVSTELVLMENK